MRDSATPHKGASRGKRLVVLALAAVCALVAGCDDYQGNGPQPIVAYKRMVTDCTSHGGMREFHNVIDNPGAPSLFGEYDYTCRDGKAGIQGWDSQGPKESE